MQDGLVLEQTSVEHPINVPGYGSLPLIPTASAWDGRRGAAREYNPSSTSQKDRNLNTFARVFPKPRTWPTPTTQDSKNDGGPSQWKRNTPPLNTAVKANPKVTGQLNPSPFVEWLMGWPIGWISCKPLAMGKFLEWLRQHGKC
jgi:hypothetical protein